MPYPVAICCCRCCCGRVLDGWFTADGQPAILDLTDFEGETRVGAAGGTNDALVYVVFREDGGGDPAAADDTNRVTKMKAKGGSGRVMIFKDGMRHGEWLQGVMLW